MVTGIYIHDIEMPPPGIHRAMFKVSEDGDAKIFIDIKESFSDHRLKSYRAELIKNTITGQEREECRKKIYEMRRFLFFCALVHNHLADDQIELINKALDALERELLTKETTAADQRSIV